MVRNQTSRVILLVVIIYWFSVGILSASSTTVQVRATILPYVKMNVLQHETRYEIRQNDIYRGYVDIPFSATVNIETNTHVLILTVLPTGSVRITASISGFNRFDDILEIFLTENERYARQVTRDLDFRVFLDENSQQGTYTLAPWITIQGY